MACHLRSLPPSAAKQHEKNNRASVALSQYSTRRAPARLAPHGARGTPCRCAMCRARLPVAPSG
eukprot:8842900-Alexandrium_andersonii.AAC.1